MELKEDDDVFFLAWDDVPREGKFVKVVDYPEKMMTIAQCVSNGIHRMPIDRVLPLKGLKQKEKDEFVKKTIDKYKENEEPDEPKAKKENKPKAKKK